MTSLRGGICIAKKTDESECDMDRECESGVCKGRKCVGKKGNSQWCNDDIECESGNCSDEQKCEPDKNCLYHTDCGKNEYCNYSFSFSWTCKEKLKNGEECDSDILSSSTCLSGRCSEGKCQELLKNGERCSFSWDCFSQYCAPSDDDYACAEKLEDGEDCLIDQECASGKCEGIFHWTCKSVNTDE